MHYRIYLDGLPAAVIVRDPVTGHVHKDYNEGIPVGKMIIDQTDIKNPKEKYLIYNHFNFVVKTQVVPESERVRIVGFEVEPRSYMPQNDKAKQPSWEYREHRPLFIDELRKLGNHEMERRVEQSFQFTYSFRTEMD